MTQHYTCSLMSTLTTSLRSYIPARMLSLSDTVTPSLSSSQWLDSAPCRIMKGEGILLGDGRRGLYLLRLKRTLNPSLPFPG